MTPVGVFFICQNEDKCHFVNSAILSQSSIAEFVPTSTEVISRRPAPGKSAGLFAFPMDNRENYDFVLHL